MPDLHIDIVRNSPASIPSVDGLFVECKPVDRDHPAGGTYCDKGIMRFVRGEYAWASTQGLMVGYASPNYTMPEKLTEAFKTRSKDMGLIGKVSACKDCRPIGYGQHAHITMHARCFVYPLTKGKHPASLCDTFGLIQSESGRAMVIKQSDANKQDPRRADGSPQVSKCIEESRGFAACDDEHSVRWRGGRVKRDADQVEELRAGAQANAIRTALKGLDGRVLTVAAVEAENDRKTIGEGV